MKEGRESSKDRSSASHDVPKDAEAVIDTSDIPELGEAFFRSARTHRMTPRQSDRP